MFKLIKTHLLVSVNFMGDVMLLPLLSRQTWWHQVWQPTGTEFGWATLKFSALYLLKCFLVHASHIICSHICFHPTVAKI
jgi:hypothetical protein